MNGPIGRAAAARTSRHLRRQCFFQNLTTFPRVLGNPAFQLDHQACIPVQDLEDLLAVAAARFKLSVTRSVRSRLPAKLDEPCARINAGTRESKAEKRKASIRR